MGRLVVNNAMTVNGAFEAPVPEPDGWLVLDADINNISLEQFLLADAMVLVVSGAGELTHDLVAKGLVDEFWFWVSPSLWPAGPRIFDGVGPVRLQLIGATTFPSGVLRLAYRPAPDQRDGASS